MFTHPEIISRLGREQQRQTRAAARQRRLGRQHGHQAPKAADIVAAVTRRRATVMAEPSR
jgi:hypothetical protein